MKNSNNRSTPLKNNLLDNEVVDFEFQRFNKNTCVPRLSITDWSDFYHQSQSISLELKQVRDAIKKMGGWWWIEYTDTK